VYKIFIYTEAGGITPPFAASLRTASIEQLLSPTWQTR
jgi:hypothetical protein